MSKYMCATYKEGKGYPVFFVSQNSSGNFHNGEKQQLCKCPSFGKAMRMTGTMNTLIAASRNLI
jgi:hypothetical protein